MKRCLLLLFAAFVTIVNLSAQKASFTQGDKVLNFGIGWGSSVYSEPFYRLIFPPVSTSFELGVASHILEKGSIGTGLYFGFYSYQYEYSNSGWNSDDFIIGATGAFHYPFAEWLDTYTGIMLGYEIVSTDNFGPENIDWNLPSDKIRFAWYIGGKYYFTETVAAFLELGYGITYVNLGIAIKL